MGIDLKQFASKVRISDGAWGTLLLARGLAPGAAPELWNADNPAAVEAVASSYAQAGADVILTNTFGGNRFIMAPHGLEERTAELVEKGAAISCKACAGTETKVFGSIGPTGKIVMMNEVPAEELSAAFAEAASALARGGCEAIVLETFNELAEIELALKATIDACDLPVVASMTFSSGPDSTATMMGNTPADLATLAADCGAAAVGANCGVGPDNYVKVTKLFKEATDLPIWIKANAGLPQLGPDGETTFPMSAEKFTEYLPQLIDAGACFIGGCCGTSPEFIAGLRTALDK